MSRTIFVSMVLRLFTVLILTVPGGVHATENGLTLEELKTLAEKRKAEDKDLALTAKEMLKKADKALLHKDAEIIVILAKLHGASDAAKAVLRFGSEEAVDIARGLLRAGQSGVEVVHTMKYLKFKVKQIADGMLLAEAAPSAVVNGLLKTKVPLPKIIGFLKKNKLSPPQMAEALLTGEVPLADLMTVMKTVDKKLLETTTVLNAQGFAAKEMIVAMKEAKIRLSVVAGALLTIEIPSNIVADFISIDLSAEQIGAALKAANVAPTVILDGLLHAGQSAENVTSVTRTLKFAAGDLAAALKTNGSSPKEIAVQLKKLKLSPNKILAELHTIGFQLDLEQVQSFLNQ